MIQLEKLFDFLPILVIGLSVILSLIIDAFTKKESKLLFYFNLLMLVVSTILFFYLMPKNYLIFGNNFKVGGLVYLIDGFINLAALLYLFTTLKYLEKTNVKVNEFITLMMNALLGIYLMIGARDFILIFVGLEIMSITFYVLAGIKRSLLSNNEASLKYFLLGAFITGFLVYGIALIYGGTNSTHFDGILNTLASGQNNILFVIGLLLFLIGFTFKIGLFPFNMWIPDVYQGAPTAATSFMATLGKTAPVVILISMLSILYNMNIENYFANFFAIASAVSMIIGSVIGIAQKNIKRMLAYSSIAHAGYFALGFTTPNIYAQTAVFYYLLAYIFMNLGAFIIITYFEDANEGNLSIDDYKGLAKKYPYLAGMLSFFMFAIAGIPPMAGFFGKYYLIIATVQGGYVWLAILLAVTSVISAYYYLRIVIYMYFVSSEKNIEVEKDVYTNIGVALVGLVVLVLGIYPQLLIDILNKSLK
ncbi:MAG TPA: NADH-quinone oxidoreductase subunit N [Ignavibacteriales bacterium]|nr:NADH-quinone oxidoreductase subunit N [Ignavibacteriales bacterium]HOL80767.1 NADH-quinone oxidoreductase subunit N [Ignavibacteriales bacterium]HOM66013.1 NADH-quinone oxidoreductase subunit N [Ignavibacteriales bacterium]HPD68360.1 NADH-quinone oxidoreductase subunit N [Ignavibacteriales bacterium]HPP33203.1 NADH-quinone oxidoreductase subunit N [Ignavibacteriales bacterium]